MPVLKVKRNGIWEELGGTSPADGGNADTLDGQHASDFALASEVSGLQILVGDASVSEQIVSAITPIHTSIQDLDLKIDGVTSVPAITADDNGKFLRVVNGAMEWQAVKSAEEVSV